mmetsp:Transcript_28716/g.77769  ORF Transcript_28716/g.77769 Transcript_28716/m.77769 type:complete len:421 (+) Transcript_28716:666-1928(+)|eukprot:CAMPEP_0172362158 /NCGR_PEP_ID=MMETSP1060-20121228/5838_1 /TAXON_ID=37318 /ORGANISM="Pseudo-nitzschia pungens, Strain cf. cingulata" /LENGTH=420 /DNA_ID=CAMNT_0013084605 /DNA_START=648 /DNA_END=1910 /DNA_ORIENTATION=-
MAMAMAMAMAMDDSSSAPTDTAKHLSSRSSLESASDNHNDFTAVAHSPPQPPSSSAVAETRTTTEESTSTIESSRQQQRPSHPPPQRLILEANAPNEIPNANDCRRGILHRGAIYMLHGWAQNVHVFSHRTRKLTKRLTAAGYRVVFLQGPHRLPPRALAPKGGTEHDVPENSSAAVVSSREHAYAWFLYHDTDETGNDRHLRPSVTGTFPGMDRSLEYFEKELRADRDALCETKSRGENQIPPTVVLGFSQGAVLVHKIATLACQQNSIWSHVRKCILVGGFSFTASMGCDRDDDQHGNGLNSGSVLARDQTTVRTIPSFHVVGANDSRVPPHLTRELYCLEPCFGHGGGDRRCRGNAHDASNKGNRPSSNVGGDDASLPFPLMSDNNHKVLWEHNRGHVVPQDLAFCQRMIEFLEAEP